MSRDLSPAHAAAVAAPQLALAVLVELDFQPDPLRLWSGLGDLLWGNRAFTGAGTLLGVGEVEETSEVAAAGLVISLSGIPAEIVDHATSPDWQGRAARIWLALLDDAGRVVGDPVQVLAGRMDTLTTQDGETATVSMTVENHLVDLERPRARRYTDADQQAEYPGDRGFEFVASLQEKEIRWGGG